MAFSQANVSHPVLSAVGRQLKAEWTTTAPAGTIFQLYVNKSLAWSGTATLAYLPWPRTTVDIQVGTVGAGEASTDFSGSLPAGNPDKATISWFGGLFQGADTVGFRVYGGTAAGGAVDYSTALADVPLTVAGVSLTGYGVGGFGSGGYGSPALPYSWTSNRLAGGTWHFAVVAYDAAGNESRPGATTTVTVVAPPREVAADSMGRRLTYTLGTVTAAGYGASNYGIGGFGSGTAELGYGVGNYGIGGYGVSTGAPSITLSWLASPAG